MLHHGDYSPSEVYSLWIFQVKLVNFIRAETFYVQVTGADLKNAYIQYV